MSGDQTKCMELLEAGEYGLLELELSQDAANVLRKAGSVFKATVAKMLIKKMHADDPIPLVYKFML